MFDETQMEQFLASAVHYLLSTGNKDIALLLAGGQLIAVSTYDDSHMSSYEVVAVCNIELRVPAQLHVQYNSDKKTAEIIEGAFKAVLSGHDWYGFTIGVTLVDIEIDWRTKLLAESETGQIHNQNSYEKKPFVYKGMRFSSPPEVEIAKALERLGVMYLPNCLARVGAKSNRKNRFPDFLICYEGKWGILEVDGKHYHSGRATEDYERSRLIEQHGGIAYFTRYDAMRCQNNPDGVVKEFLDILRKK